MIPYHASILQRLRALDQTLPGFPDQFAIVLAEKEFKDHIPHLQDGDGVWLVEYMNTVRTFPCTSVPLFKDSVGPQ